MATNVDLLYMRPVGIYLRTLNDWGQVKYLYMVFSTWYALLFGILIFEFTWYTYTWRQRYLILVPRTFVKLTKIVLNVIQQSITKHHNQNYWNGSLMCVFTAWDLVSGHQEWTAQKPKLRYLGFPKVSLTHVFPSVQTCYLYNNSTTHPWFVGYWWIATSDSWINNNLPPNL